MTLLNLVQEGSLSKLKKELKSGIEPVTEEVLLASINQSSSSIAYALIAAAPDAVTTRCFLAALKPHNSIMSKNILKALNKNEIYITTDCLYAAIQANDDSIFLLILESNARIKPKINASRGERFQAVQDLFDNKVHELNETSPKKLVALAKCLQAQMYGVVRLICPTSLSNIYKLAGFDSESSVEAPDLKTAEPKDNADSNQILQKMHEEFKVDRAKQSENFAALQQQSKAKRQAIDQDLYQYASETQARIDKSSQKMELEIQQQKAEQEIRQQERAERKAADLTINQVLTDVCLADDASYIVRSEVIEVGNNAGCWDDKFVFILNLAGSFREAYQTIVRTHGSDPCVEIRDFLEAIVNVKGLTVKNYDEGNPAFCAMDCDIIAHEVQCLSNKVAKQQLTEEDIQNFTDATQSYTTCSRMKAALAALAGAALGLVVGFAIAGVPGAVIGAVAGLGLFGGGYVYVHQRTNAFTELAEAAKPLVVAPE